MQYRHNIFRLDPMFNAVIGKRNKESGHEVLVQMNYTGTSPLLTPEQQEELIQHLDKNLYIDSKDIIQHIHKTYDIKYSPSGMKELLHRIGFVYKNRNERLAKLTLLHKESLSKSTGNSAKTRVKTIRLTLLMEFIRNITVFRLTVGSDVVRIKN